MEDILIKVGVAHQKNHVDWVKVIVIDHSTVEQMMVIKVAWVILDVAITTARGLASTSLKMTTAVTIQKMCQIHLMYQISSQTY